MNFHEVIVAPMLASWALCIDFGLPYRYGPASRSQSKAWWFNRHFQGLLRLCSSPLFRQLQGVNQANETEILLPSGWRDSVESYLAHNQNRTLIIRRQAPSPQRLPLGRKSAGGGRSVHWVTRAAHPALPEKTRVRAELSAHAIAAQLQIKLVTQ